MNINGNRKSPLIVTIGLVLLIKKTSIVIQKGLIHVKQLAISDSNKNMAVS